jgi:hypothetical protein
MPYTADWTARDGDDNSASAATKAGITSQRHVVTSITASYATTPASPKLLEIKDGSTVIWSVYITAAFTKEFTPPLRISSGADAIGAMAASGTGGVVSTVTIAGYTER